MVDVTLFHNPMCSTSRAALELIRQAGIEPEIVEYKTVGWTADQLKALAAAAGVPVSAFLRAKEPIAVDLGLNKPGVSEEAIIGAMIAHPILVERPIVKGPRGVALGRPVERITDVF